MKKKATLNETKTAPPPPDTKNQQPPTPEQIKAQEDMNATVKEIEGAIFAVKFYPVAVNEEAKNKAVEKLEEIYRNGNDAVRQLLLYMVHEILATSSELRAMHTYDYFKMKTPNAEPSQLRINVYRAMFNYNTSLEGLVEMIKFLGRLKGNDDAIKLLTYHFSHLCSAESEATHILRSAILETLGKSESQYALRSLLDYAQYCDHEKTYNRVVSALISWEPRIDKLKMKESEKQEIREKLKELMSREFSESHYG